MPQTQLFLVTVQSDLDAFETALAMQDFIANEFGTDCKVEEISPDEILRPI